MRVEQFFGDVERSTGQLSAEEKNAFAVRVTKARELLGGIGTLQRLRAWNDPTERLRPEDVALLSAEKAPPFDDEA